MPFTPGNPGPHAFKPKYTGEDLDEIRKDLIAKLPYEQVVANVYKRHPDISFISIARWINKVSSELGK